MTHIHQLVGTKHQIQILLIFYRVQELPHVQLEVVIICFFLEFFVSPYKAVLLDSVPPEVSKISSGEAFMILEICFLACLIAFSVCLPYR